MTTTSAKDMRAKRQRGIEFLLLEYGDIVFIRPMDAAFFFKTGRIPDFLTPTVQKMLIEGGSISEAKELAKSPERVGEWLTWLDELIKWTVISPKVVDNPQADDELGVDELDYKDKLAIYSWFGQPAEALRRFRDKQINPVELVDEKQDAGPKTERDIKRSAVGQ